MTVVFAAPLLRALLAEVLPQGAAHDGNAVEPRFFFAPAQHLDALRPDRPIVVGMRGAGKTYWWSALQNEQLRARLAESFPQVSLIGNARVTAGFGTRSAEEYPSERTLERLLPGVQNHESIWLAVLGWQTWGQRHDEFSRLETWAERARWIDQNTEREDLLFREYDRGLEAEGRRHLVVFDALDRTSEAPVVRRTLLRALLRVTLRALSWKALRAKAFVRPDMLDGVFDFPDASKLMAARAELRWSPTDLYALLWQYLGNGSAASSMFRAGSQQLSKSQWFRSAGAWLCPNTMVTDETVQERVFHQITGPAMGPDRRRGIPYRWLPGHLSDAYRQVAPRSFLTALHHAASRMSHVGWPWALHYDDIKAGVLEASRVRVSEVKEDLPWIGPAMSELEGLVLPTHLDEVMKRLRDADRLQEIRDALGVESLTSRQVLDRLIAAGLMYRTPDGRISMPDVYRVAFGLRLKGAVAPPRR